MSKQNKTEIFPPEILPVRSGVYKTRSFDAETGKPLDEPWAFSYFDFTDKIWGCSHPTVAEAWAYPEFEFAIQSKEWTKLPEEAA